MTREPSHTLGASVNGKREREPDETQRVKAKDIQQNYQSLKEKRSGTTISGKRRRRRRESLKLGAVAGHGAKGEAAMSSENESAGRLRAKGKRATRRPAQERKGQRKGPQ